MRLEGKVAIVTGSGRGMGEQIARAYAHEGAKVAVCDIDEASARTVAESLLEGGAQAISTRIDVRQEADANAVVALAEERFGRLDILVNNAGISMTKTFLNTTKADMEAVFAVNLVGAFLCAQAAARAMLKVGGGRIINIASLSGQRGGVGRCAYGVSKAGLELMTRVMSVELASRGVVTNAIAPGAIDTPMAAAQHDQATRDAYHYLIPQRRYGQPSEIADAAVFLASDEARHICGHTLNVDGGYQTAGLMFGRDDVEAPRAPVVRAPG